MKSKLCMYMNIVGVMNSSQKIVRRKKMVCIKTISQRIETLFFLLFHQQKDLQELNDSFTCSSGVKQDSSTINGQSQRSKPHFRRHDHLYVICMVWWYGSMVGSVVCYFVCPRIARKVVSIQTNVNVSGNSYL